MDETLLPDGASQFEQSVSLATAQDVRLVDAVTSIRTAKLVSPPATFLPFLVYEYGLGMLTPYVADPIQIISGGIAWERIRGTPAALAQGLSWVGYSAVIVEAAPRRLRWNLFSLALDRARDNEDIDLGRIAGISALSVCARSQFVRGFFGYDAGPSEWSYGKWGGGLWSAASGARVEANGPLWSFSRTYEIAAALTQAELVAIGAWIAPVSGAIGWGAVTWNGAFTSWAPPADAARSAAISTAIVEKTIYAAFRDADGVLIGYRRARVQRAVAPLSGGPYQFEGFGFTPSDAATCAYVDVLTAFSDGYGAHARFVTLVFGAAPMTGTPPGTPWIAPGGLIGGVELALLGASVVLSQPDQGGAAIADGLNYGGAIAPTFSGGLTLLPVSIVFGRTVRERIRFLLTF
jgi:hypothetical protein